MPLALAIGAVAAAGIGAVATTSAANKAAKTAQNTAAANNATQTQIYNQNKDTLQPFVNSGTQATTSINALLGLSGDATATSKAYDAYKGSDEYQSRLAEGQKSVEATLGAKGLLDSGAAQKSLLKYGQTFAGNEFGQYLGNLQGQQQTGLSAASALAGSGQNYANATSANNNAASETVSNAALSSAGTVNGVLSSALSAYAYGTGSSYKAPQNVGVLNAGVSKGLGNVGSALGKLF